MLGYWRKWVEMGVKWVSQLDHIFLYIIMLFLNRKYTGYSFINLMPFYEWLTVWLSGLFIPVSRSNSGTDSHDLCMCESLWIPKRIVPLGLSEQVKLRALNRIRNLISHSLVKFREQLYHLLVVRHIKYVYIIQYPTPEKTAPRKSREIITIYKLNYTYRPAL